MVSTAMSLTKYEHMALDQVRFLAKQHIGDPLAFGHTLEVVKEGYRVDIYMRSDPIRWDAILRQAESEDGWPFVREVTREGTQTKATFHGKESNMSEYEKETEYIDEVLRRVGVENTSSRARDLLLPGLRGAFGVGLTIEQCTEAAKSTLDKISGR